MRRLAERDGVSLNEAALRMLREGAVLTDAKKPNGPIGHSLDHLVGAWTAEEAAEFDAALEVFETIDEEVWK